MLLLAQFARALLQKGNLLDLQDGQLKTSSIYRMGELRDDDIDETKRHRLV